MHLLLALLLLSPNAYAALSILQDEKGLICKSSQINKLTLDRRDRELQLTIHGKTTKYTAESFLDSAVLMKSDKDYGLFQIFENGKVIWWSGELHSMKESDCEDSGASKTCKNKLYWSSSQLKFNKWESAVTRYGHYPNDGTYFFAGSITKPGKAAYVIDYGAKFDVLFGHAQPLECKYQ